MTMYRLVALSMIVAALLCVGAGPSSAAPARTTFQPVTHIVLVLEENHSRSQALAGMPYLAGLAKTYATAPNYQNITHPSLPNYIALASGGTQGFDGNDCAPSPSCQTSAENIYHQTGSSWREWAESANGTCDKSNHGDYAPRHTFVPYFSDVAALCKANDIPLSLSKVPSIAEHYITVTPNLQHDAHDGTLAQADAWLKQFLGVVLKRGAYTDGSTLVEVTFDEGSGSLLTVFINPRFHGVTVSGGPYSHYSLLRLNEELLGNRLIGHAADAHDLRPGLGL